MTETNELILTEKLIITGKIIIKTGLHIGGSNVALDIGGIDNSVIKDASGIPYIPGSSLKGKIRALLEKHAYPLRNEDKKDGKGKFTKTIHQFDNKSTDDIIAIFGLPADENVPEQIRGVFRDCYLDYDLFNKEKNEGEFENLDLEYTEDKIEVALDRITSKANPRHLERVPRGARFDFELILNIYQEKDHTLLKTLIKGMKLLEDDYLGGSGSRGSGKIEFSNITLVKRNRKYYEFKFEEQKSKSYNSLKELSDDLTQENWWNNVFN